MAWASSDPPDPYRYHPQATWRNTTKLFALLFPQLLTAVWRHTRWHLILNIPNKYNALFADLFACYLGTFVFILTNLGFK